jgi:hypothetical protein
VTRNDDDDNNNNSNNNNNKKDTVCLLTDAAIPSDRNVIQNEAEKILKYKNLSTEI